MAPFWVPWVPFWHVCNLMANATSLCLCGFWVSRVYVFSMPSFGVWGFWGFGFQFLGISQGKARDKSGISQGKVWNCNVVYLCMCVGKTPQTWSVLYFGCPKASKILQMGTKWGPNGSKMSSKCVQNGSKMVPGGPWVSLGVPGRALGLPGGVPGGSQGGPWGSLGGPWGDFGSLLGAKMASKLS